MKIITIVGCVSDMIKSAMITEWWKPQSSHEDTFFSIYMYFVSSDLHYYIRWMYMYMLYQKQYNTYVLHK